jgi:hypothetical protein
VDGSYVHEVANGVGNSQLSPRRKAPSFVGEVGKPMNFKIMMFGT